MKKSKINFPIIFISIMIFFLFATGIASWIISISSHFILGEYSQIGEIISNLDTTTVTYDGDIHLPVILDDEVISNETYTIQFKEKDSTLFPQNVYDEDGYLIRGPINAGTYIISYKNKTNPDIVAEVEFVVDKATPTLLESGYPTLGSTIYGKLPSITQATGTVAIHPEYYLHTESNPKIVSGTYTFVDENATKTTEYIGTAETSTVSTKVLFVPTDSDNYYSVEASVNFTLEAVAKHVFSENDATITNYYGRIEDALDNANIKASGTVIALIGKNPTIYRDCEVNSGITLLIGYNNDSFVGERKGTDTSQVFADANDDRILANRKNTVYINDNITLTINGGTLNIDGILGAATGGLSGATSGEYAEIVLGSSSNIKLLGGATFNCYGYVKEKTLDNQSKVSLYGATVNMPFVIHDFRGGTNTVVTFRYGNIAPFTVFDMPNIQSEFYINSSSVEGTTGTSIVYALVDLYANDQHNPDEIVIISSNSSATGILNIDNGYIKIKYNPTTLGYSTKETDTTSIDICGDGHTSSLSITISFIITVPVSLDEVYFGIPYKFDISFINCDYEIRNPIKLMPGSKVYIDESATVNIVNNTNVILYSYYDDVGFGGYVYPNYEGAELTVNGTLNVNSGGLAGIVKTTNTGARLFINSSASVELKSNEGNSGSSSSAQVVLHITSGGLLGDYEYVNIFVADENLRGLTVSSGNNYSSFSSGNYQSLNGRWYSESCVIYYNPNGGELTGSTFEPVEGSPYNTPYVISTVNTTSPIREHYIFMGWYADPDCTIPVYAYDEEQEIFRSYNYQIYCNTYIYAKWIPIEYPIAYEYGYINCEAVEDAVITNATTSFTIETNSPLSIPDHSSEYVFGGWFEDFERTKPISNLIGSEYIDRISTGVKFYGLWYPKGTNTYKVTYVHINNNDEEFNWGFRNIVSLNVNSYTHPSDCTKYNNDPSYSKYFIGWYIDESCTTPFNSNVHLVSDITLYGKWEDKHTISFDYGEVTGSLTYFIYTNQTFEFPMYTFDLQVNSDNFIQYIGKWTDGTNKHIVGADSPPVKESTVYTLIKEVEKTFYKVTVSNTDTVTTVSVNDNYMIVKDYQSIGDNLSPTTLESFYIQVGATVTVSVKYNKGSNRSINIKKKDGTSVSSGFTMENTTYTITAHCEDGGCFSGDTIIKTNKGDKYVYDIQEGDLILSFNHYTGEYQYSEIASVILHGVKTHTIMNLCFNDGSNIEFIDYHGLYCVELNKYVDINLTNYSDYIGMHFIKFYEGKNVAVQLIEVDIYQKYTGSYTVITKENINCIANGLLNITSYLYGVYNIFDYQENMTFYDNQIKEDINKYGLYEYSEFEHLITKKIFVDFGFKYFKISISKGFMTYDQLLFYIAWFNHCIQSGEALIY